MRCLNKLNLIYYDHVMMCNNNNITLSRFEMFLIKTLFFLIHIFALRLPFYFLIFEGRESHSKKMATSYATGWGIL